MRDRSRPKPGPFLQRLSPRLASPTAIWFASLILLGAPLPGWAQSPESHDDLDFFETRIRPLLVDHCLSCHGETKQQGELRLDTHAGLLRGGDSGPAFDESSPLESLLWSAVNYDGLEMPPEQPLSPSELSDLRHWLERGAAWPPDTQLARSRKTARITAEDRDYWAFRPLQRVPRPMVDNTQWGRTAVDDFLLSQWEQTGIAPAAEAAPEVLLRRLAFGLTGLPPTESQLERWQQSPTDATWETLVDEMLDSPRFGEHWGQLWLDLVRYADSDGYKADGFRPQAYRYRDYVIEAFNQDKPLDQFVLEQLAGDLLEPVTAEGLVATGYLRNWIYEYNQRDARSQWAYILDDITETTGDVFFGLGLGCAKCHDHKYDPLLQTDYYRLQACFAGILPVEDLLVAPSAERQRYHEAVAAWEHETESLRTSLAELEAPARKAATASAVEKFPPDIREMFAKPSENRSTYEQQLVDLAWRQAKLEVEKIDFEKKLSGESLESWQNLRAQLQDAEQRRPALPPTAWGVRELATVATITIPDSDESVTPGVPEVLRDAGNSDPLASQVPGRLALARWLVSDENPITARVMVNRVWQHLFGEGLAPNANDFGQLGGSPFNPELLDYLADEFRASGWRWKSLIRSIVLSSAYRLSSQPQSEVTDAAGSISQGSFRRRRLSAGQLRDAILLASQELEDVSGGPSRDLHEPVRTIYLKVLRNHRQPLLDVFDFPDRIRSVGQRNETTTPQQALLLINGPWALQQAASLAERARSYGQDQPRRGIEAVFRWTLSRAAHPEEVESCESFLASQQRLLQQDGRSAEIAQVEAWVDLCHGLLNCNEFIFLD